eukprot:TRINITY_DN3888_c0_g1_i2.p1 TRINITY_DN3888_c0_g1~~TRINITY_DN3888_c0_g1_i2.p1  ORF type:complete len:206 (+),score=39.47 TRINITY_DN3888_c0_g1_i2:52-669(+)
MSEQILPCVFITPRLMRVSSTNEVRECLSSEWTLFCAKIGALPLPLLTQTPISHAFDTIRPVGVIFSGGNDLSVVAPTDDLSALRDAFEISLLHEAIRRRIPVIGVCRGMQLIAHVAGLKLSPCQGHVATNHQIHPVHENAVFSSWAKINDDLVVNSFHNWAVDLPNGDDALGFPLSIAYVSQDGKEAQVSWLSLGSWPNEQIQK